MEAHLRKLDWDFSVQTKSLMKKKHQLQRPRNEPSEASENPSIDGEYSFHPSPVNFAGCFQSIAIIWQSIKKNYCLSCYLKYQLHLSCLIYHHQYILVDFPFLFKVMLHHRKQSLELLLDIRKLLLIFERTIAMPLCLY